MHALRHFYENSTGNRLPAKPSSRGELDVLKERHQCATRPFRLGYSYGYGELTHPRRPGKQIRQR